MSSLRKIGTLEDMDEARAKMFRKIVPELLTQVAYYADDLEVLISERGPMATLGWRRYRRTESIRVYPGYEQTEMSFYIAHHGEYLPGFETELIQPLALPNYIATLDVLPGQIAHLGIDVSGEHPLTNEDDKYILRKIGVRSDPQLIQRGAVRVGRKWKHRYAIYSSDDLLPVKITR